MPAPSITPQVVSDATPSRSEPASAPSTEESSLSSFHLELASALDIPSSLTTRPKIVDVRLAYAKYKAFHQAQLEHYRMVGDGQWDLRTPSVHDLITLFVSKSVWYSNYVKIFPVAKTFPLLFEWLEKPYNVKGDDENDTSELNVMVFGVDKPIYTFGDLKTAIAVLEKARGKKGKGKRKADDSGDEGKRSHKKKKTSSSRS